MSLMFAYRFRPLVTCALVCALALVVAAAPPGLTSTWRTHAVNIDGMASEWPKLESIARGPEVGAVNDEEFLYLAVSTNDDAIRPLLETGLIVWLDPNGAKAQTFGVWVPGPVLRALPGANPAPPSDSSPTGISTRTLDHFDLLGPGKSQRRLVDLTAALGIELASGTQENKLIYELRIPLTKTAERLYAVGAGPGRTIGLGIATPEAPKDRSGRREPLVGSSGYIGGNPYHGGGFAPYRERQESVKPLDVWTTVRLATKQP
jgi:hypothetical protein